MKPLIDQVTFYHLLRSRFFRPEIRFQSISLECVKEIQTYSTVVFVDSPQIALVVVLLLIKR